jgi:hypothetical protein
MSAADQQHKNTDVTADKTVLSTRSASAVRAYLGQITERFEAAHRRALQAQAIKDYEAAEAERREIAGDFWLAEEELAQFGLMLVRLAFQHHPNTLRLWLTEALRPELEEIADAQANLEARTCR